MSSRRPFPTAMLVVWHLSAAFSLLGLCMALAHAQTPPELQAPMAQTPPRIDGLLDDACWQTAPQITQFRCVDAQRSEPTRATQAWIACDADALYVAARCADDQMDRVLATVTERDGPVWQDDCLEVFLMPGAPYYYHFGANLLGARYDARHGVGTPPDEAGPQSWDAEWQVASRREADCWTMEVLLPLACMEWGSARLEAPLRFNIGREQRRLAEFSCWPASGFNRSEEFALLREVPIDPLRYGLLVTDVTSGQVIPGANRYTATIAEEPAPGAAMTVRARIRALPDGQEQASGIRVTSSPGARVELDYQVPPMGGRVAAVFEYVDSEGRTRLSRSELWRVPAPVEGSLDLPLLYISDGEVRVSGSVSLRGQVTLDAALVSGGAQLSTVSVPVGPDGAFHVRMPVRDLEPGRYAVQTRLSVEAAAAPVLDEFPFRLIRGPLD